MCIFALDKRLGRAVLAIVHARVIPVVHRAEYVREFSFAGRLVLYRAGRVLLFHPAVAVLEIGTEPCLVAQGPEYYRRMVEIPAHVSLVPFKMRLPVCLAVRKALVTVAHPVGLYIGLGHDIEPVLVAQVVPIRVVRIVACAHGIDIQLFHTENILKHPFT